MLAHTHRVFVPELASILLHKEFSSGYVLFVDVVFMTEGFREFQMTIVEEGIGQIIDILEDESVLFEDAVNTAEEILQNINEKLISFADKMTSVSNFNIRGIVTLSRHTDFVSAVIGDVSLVLLRKGRVGYTMQNDSDSRHKIALFSDVVEGDIGLDDVVIFFGAHVQTFFDREEMDNIALRVSSMSIDEQVQERENAFHARVVLSDVGLFVAYAVDTDLLRTTKRTRNVPTPQFLQGAGDSVQYLLERTRSNVGQKIKNKQFIILAVMVGVFILFVLWSIVQGWMKNTTSQTINPDGTVTASLSIEDIKKEIAMFQKLDATSDEKGVKYNTLIQELQRIKQEGKWANDVEQLKKILDIEYLQGFNIVVLDSFDDHMVYAFSSLEQQALVKPLEIFFQKGLYIAGTKGAVLAGISNDIRGTTVRSIVNEDFTACTMSLLKNGMYCATTKNNLFFLSKAGTEIMGGETIVFPGSIVGLATFGSSNFYTLTQDANYTKDKTYLVKYANVLGSQNTFGGNEVLPLGPSATDMNFSQGFSSISIDGTFLVWSKDKKTLYQFFRNPQDKTLTVRQVPLKGGTTISGGFSDNVKVMTTASTRYVYLYDRINKTLSIYVSTPAKSNTDYSNTYGLDYLMRLDLSKTGTMPADIYIDESDGTQNAYVLLPTGIAKIQLTDLLESLKKQKTQ